MTHNLWLERPFPAEYEPLVAGKLVVQANATQTPDSPELKVIARTGIGYDNIDVPAATERGICVCNVPDGPTRSTAEHAIALMFAVCRELKIIDQMMAQGGVLDFFSVSKSIELHNKTLGLVGFGRIGRCTADLARGIGMNVQVHDPYVSEDDRADCPEVRFVDSLDELLSTSHVVSIHVPLMDATRHLINAERLAQMQPGSMLVNCSRGGTVDEQALHDALVSGHLAGAGLDVFETEPPAPDHPLLQLPQVIATPHIAAATDACKQRLWEGALTQIMDACAGKRPAHLVNTEVWQDTVTS